MNELTQTAGHLSKQDDRYLFIIVLLVLLTFAWIVLKHLTRQNAELVTKLESEQKASRETNERLILCIDHNTNALKETTIELSKCRETCTFRRPQ